MGATGEILLVQRSDDRVRSFWSEFVLVMLNQAVGVKGISDGAVEVEGDARGLAVGGHEGGVFLHLGVRVGVFGFFVPRGWGGMLFGERGGGMGWMGGLGVVRSSGSENDEMRCRVPFILVLSCLTSFGVELEGKVLDGESHVLGGRRGAEPVERFLVSSAFDLTVIIFGLQIEVKEMFA